MSVLFESDYHKSLIRKVNPASPRYYLDKCVYNDSNSVGTLAYPPLFCTEHTNQSYPQKSRAAFQPSSVACKGTNLCLSNEGTIIVYYGRHGDNSDVPLCFVGNSPNLNYARANVVTNVDRDLIFVSPVLGNDPDIQIPPIFNWFIANPGVYSYNGSVDASYFDDDFFGSRVILHRPDFTGVDIPDDFGTGQVTGGSSYACHSLTAVVKMPKSWPEPEVVFPSQSDVQTYLQVTMKFEDVVGNWAAKHVRTIAEDGDYVWYQIDAVMVSPGVLRSSNQYFYHQFFPYFFIQPSGGRFYVYDMLWTIRLFDTIKSNPT